MCKSSPSAMRIVLSTALICLAALPLWPTVSYATTPLLSEGDGKTDGQAANQADTATVNGQASANPSNLVGPDQNASKTRVWLTDTRVWLSLPDSCVQNTSDSWIECRDREGRPLAQFMFLVGESATPSEAKFLTQDNLQRQFEQKSSQSEPVAEFKEKVETWLSGQKSGGGKQTGEINYDFLKSDKGVWAIYASYTYENRNGVECLIQLVEIWDDGKAIDLAINFPMSGNEIEDYTNAQLVDEALKSIEISER
jgi:hypothetical protein